MPTYRQLWPVLVAFGTLRSPCFEPSTQNHHHSLAYTGLEALERMKKWLKAACESFFLIGCLLAWAAVAMNYGDGVATGTYKFEQNGESSTLSLHANHTFTQVRRTRNIEQHSEGTWEHQGEGGFSFSKEFLVVTGDEPEPDGTTFSDMHKLLGLFPSLELRQYHVLWYGRTSAGAGDSPVGTYKGYEPNVIATLTLHEDHTFAQTLTHNDVTKQASGTWRQDANGTIWFSNQFIKTSGKSLSPDELASSVGPNGSNLQIEISLAPHIPKSVFRKGLGFL